MSAESTIRDWVERAAAGDLLAVQKLIVMHHHRLRAAAVARTSPERFGRIEADDLLQQAYVDVVAHIGGFKYRGPSSFFHWLERILESKWLDARRYHRAAARSITREARPADTASGYEALAARVPIDSMTPSRVVAREEAHSLLMAALAGLSDDHRRVLQLRYIEALSLTDTAARMNRTPAAVQMLSTRALRQLRAIIHRVESAAT